MSRYGFDRRAAAAMHVAQETRRAGKARAADHSYATGCKFVHDDGVKTAPQTSLLDLRVLHLTLPLPPTVNEAWHHIAYVDRSVSDPKKQLRVRTALTEEHRHFRSVVIALCRGHMRDTGERDAPLLGRLSLTIELHFRNRRRTDIDNRVKPLQDALTEAGAYKDDSQIDALEVRRIVSDVDEHCRITLQEIA